MGEDFTDTGERGPLFAAAPRIEHASVLPADLISRTAPAAGRSPG
jgi:hypothetical protein